MIAFVFASGLPTGAGMRSTMASSNSLIPIPAFAEVCIASVASIPILLSISSATFSGSAAGRSILFITGISSKSLSSAK